MSRNRRFRQWFNREKLGINSSSNDQAETLKAEGSIKELYVAQVDGCTFYYFKIEGSSNLYMSFIKNRNKQVLLKEDMNVSIEYISTSEEGVYLVKKIQF